MAETNTCGACKYWHALNGGIGECRFNAPPIVTAQECRVTDADAQGEWRWPVTADVEWCGQYVTSLRASMPKPNP